MSVQNMVGTTRKRLLLREIRYLEQTIDALDLSWLRKSPELLPGVVVTTQLPAELVSRIQHVTLRFGGAPSEPWFVCRDHAAGDGIPNDDTEFKPLNVIISALLLTLNPNLRFGPLLGAQGDESGWNFFFEWYDEFHELLGPARKLPLDFCDYELSPTFEDVQVVAEELSRKWQHPIIKLACDRYMRACFAKTCDVAVLELSIALEVLLLCNDPAKRKLLARRAAIALGSTETQRSDLYRDTCALYKLRNRVVHEGQLRSAGSLAGIEVNSTVLVRSCRKNVAHLIRLFLRQQSFDKAQLLSSLDERARSVEPDLADYEKRFVLSTSKKVNALNRA
jgi:hypothetical protein